MSKMSEASPKTTRVSFRLDQNLKSPMKASNTISKQNPVSIIKKKDFPNTAAATSAATFKALPKTKVACLAPAKMFEQTVKPINANASTKTRPLKKLTRVYSEVHAHKKNVPPSTKLNASSENKKLNVPPNVHESRAIPSRSLPKIGLNQLIIVSCEEKKQVYCQLCSVRLRTSSHSTSLTHCCNYVKMKYPGWSAELSDLEAKLKDVVVHLAEIEKTLGSQKPQRMEVKKELYLKLADLSETQAVEELKAIVRQNSGDSSSINENGETPQQKAQTSCEGYSLNDGVFSRLPGHDANQETAGLHQIRWLHVKETVKPEPFMPVADAQPNCNATPLMEIPRPIMEKADTLSPPEMLLNSASPSPDAPKAVCPPNVEICSLQKGAGPAQMILQELSDEIKNAPKHGKAPREHNGLPLPSITSFGRRAPGCSNLSCYLQVSQVDIKHVIGTDYIWECRGICLETFFLCESCEETIARCEICQHMVSLNHQLKYMWKRHREFLQIFWLERDLPLALKRNILLDIVSKLAERDQVLKIDAKCIILEKQLHQFVRMAQFSTALKTVQKILKEEGKPTVHLSLSAALPIISEAGRNPKVTVSEERTIVGPSDVVTETNFTPVDINFSSTTTDLGGSLVPNPGVHLATCVKSYAFPKLEFPSTISWPQSSGQKLDTESTSCTAVRQPLKDYIRGSTRKRPADSPVPTSDTTSIPVTDPPPAKATCIVRKIKSEPVSPTSVSPPIKLDAGSSLLAVKDDGAGPRQVKSTVNEDFLPKLISHVKQCISKHHIKKINTCEKSSMEMPKTKLDSKINIKSENVSPTWDSKCHLFKATVKNNLPSNSLEGNTMAVSDSASLANASSSEDLLKERPAENATKEKPITAPAPAADLHKLQDLHFGAHKNCKNMIRLPNSGPIPEPMHCPEPARTVISHPTFNTTTRDQPNLIKHMSQDSYKRLAHTNVNRDHEISLHINLPPRLPYTVAASGGCNQHMQASCGPRMNSGHIFSEAAAIQKPQMDSLISAEGLRQQYVYTSQIYPRQMVNPLRLSHFRNNFISQVPREARAFHLPCFSFTARMGI